MLDIGCGPGLLAKDIAATVGPGGAVVGIDVSAPMTTIARKRCEAFPWSRFEVADATSLPFEDGSFDVAVTGLMLAGPSHRRRWVGLRGGAAADGSRAP